MPHLDDELDALPPNLRPPAVQVRREWSTAPHELLIEVDQRQFWGRVLGGFAQSKPQILQARLRSMLRAGDPVHDDEREHAMRDTQRVLLATAAEKGFCVVALGPLELSPVYGFHDAMAWQRRALAVPLPEDWFADGEALPGKDEP